MDWKIVSLEMCNSNKQISEVFNHIWPERLVKRKLEFYNLIHANAIYKLIKDQLKNIDEKILTVYGSGDAHHYTYGLYKEAEKKFGECCYWHFDKHPDWGNKDPKLGCGGFVNYLTEHSLSGCVRAIGNDAGNSEWNKYEINWYNYRGLDLGRKINNIIIKKDIKKLIKDSTEKAYLSFDLDVMKYGEIKTDWGNGHLKISNLISIIDIIQNEREIISADVLGYSTSKNYYDAKSLVLYLIIAGKILGEDVKEFRKLHKYLKKKDDVNDMKTLLKCLG